MNYKVLIYLVLVVLGSSCSGDCSEITNNPPETIPPELEQELFGFLNYNTWILSNDQGDTIIFTAKELYSEGVFKEEFGGSSKCNAFYEGTRQFEYKTKSSGDSTFGSSQKFISLEINSGSRSKFLVDPFFTYDASTQSRLANAGSVLLDSIQIEGQTFYDVFIYEEMYPIDSVNFYYAFNKSFGFIATNAFFPSQATTLDTAY